MTKRGEIYWVDWGAGHGHEQGGTRPALVIQNDIGNRLSPTTIVAAVTTRARRPYPFHVDVTAAESGLRQDSTVLLEQLQTIDQDRLRDQIGVLGEERMGEVDEALHWSLGMA
jgi:mRNA interferase MazF